MGMPLDAAGGVDSSYDSSYSDGSDNSSNVAPGNTPGFGQDGNQDMGSDLLANSQLDPNQAIENFQNGGQDLLGGDDAAIQNGDVDQTSEQACSGDQNTGTEVAAPAAPNQNTDSLKELIKAMAEEMGISEEEATKKLESSGGGVPATQNSGAMFP
jgi:hypothetical protein